MQLHADHAAFVDQLDAGTLERLGQLLKHWSARCNPPDGATQDVVAKVPRKALDV